VAPPEANDLLADLLEAHDLPAEVDRGWIFTAEDTPPLSAEFFNQRQQESVYALQLDVRAGLADGRMLVESFAGWGPSLPDAATRAFANFAVNSLHVLLGAFFRKPDDQILVEEWEIAGARWKAFIGNLGINARCGEQRSLPDSLFPTIERLIRSSRLDQDMHWFRFFYCNVGTGEVVTEALFDNESWQSGEEALRSLPWERADSYYSVREFLVLRRIGDGD